MVDDNLLNLKVAEKLLKPYKFKVTSLRSGLECLNFTKHKKYDLITKKEYIESVNGAVEFLKKGSKETLRDLETQMSEFKEEVKSNSPESCGIIESQVRGINYNYNNGNIYSGITDINGMYNSWLQYLRDGNENNITNSPLTPALYIVPEVVSQLVTLYEEGDFKNC